MYLPLNFTEVGQLHLALHHCNKNSFEQQKFVLVVDGNDYSRASASYKLNFRENGHLSPVPGYYVNKLSVYAMMLHVERLTQRSSKLCSWLPLWLMNRYHVLCKVTIRGVAHSETQSIYNGSYRITRLDLDMGQATGQPVYPGRLSNHECAGSKLSNLVISLRQNEVLEG
jgi:hypothetical protein